MTDARITAVLGPTNTGKTHFAMERMLARESGMIGFPLRLLARENFERAVALKGAGKVALITGEEKVVPPGARYFLCTVESMPVDRPVAFVGVDEIQLAADADRGHVFTERLLHLRGREETMFMGADTIKGLLKRLVPEAEVVSRQRFSTLSHAGPRKLARLPRRSAIVAFSAAGVYELAEAVRRQTGGAAVVLGALSPRTRNAQVAMYQAGEVEYMVATDAIGMGLNMDVNHVAFAGTRKFDGRRLRALRAAEMAQIAGRAGRHMNDGSFGTTADARPLDPGLVERIENHHFDPLANLFWRNPELSFASLGRLRATLNAPPPLAGLLRVRGADDELALATLCRDGDVVRRAVGADNVGLLWDVCQIPDFRKLMSDVHARLLATIYGHLAGPGGRLPPDWVARQVTRIDNPSGDIDTLSQRIAHIRTWTYVAYRGDWLEDAGHWQERTRAVEDRLSDALHERLTQRFVDRRTTVLVRGLSGDSDMAAGIRADGAVTVEGHFVGQLEGFRFVADHARKGVAGRVLSRAAEKALAGEIARRARLLGEAPDAALSLDADGFIRWHEAPVGRLTAGAAALAPGVQPWLGDLVEPLARERIRQRLGRWLSGHIETTLAALVSLGAASLTGPARGLAFQLTEYLGSMPRALAAEQVAALGRAGRRGLRETGVRLGRESIYLPTLLKPRQAGLRALLWAVHRGLEPVPAALPESRVSVPVAAGTDLGWLEASGFRPFGSIAVRIDMLERLATLAWERTKAGAFTADADFMSLAGCGAEGIAEIVEGLGYRPGKRDQDRMLYRRRPAGARPGRPATAAPVDAVSPFAALGKLAWRR